MRYMDAAAVKTLKEAEVVATKPRGEFVSNVVGKKLEVKGKGGLKKKAPLVAILVLIVAVPAILFSTTVLYPFHLAANMVQKVMTVWATVKEKFINVIHELLGKGKIPDKLQESLEVSGIEVGAVTATGEFIKTNQVVAEGAEYVVAAGEGAGFKVASGALSLRFMGRIISADEFLTEVKTNHQLYNAVTDAIGGQSSIFYDRAGQEAFDEIGIKRNPYAGFESTGDAEADQAKFEKMFAQLLDYQKDVSIDNAQACNAVYDAQGREVAEDCDLEDDDEGNSTKSQGTVSGSSAEEYIASVAENTKGKNESKATKNAAALLNAAVSANEPVQASKAVSGILIAVEQAKAGDNGPINEAANLMMRESESTYADPATGEQKTVKSSPAEAANMSAVTAEGSFSAEVASRYSRDRVATVLTSSKDEISNTAVFSQSGLSRFVGWIGSLFKGNTSPNEAELKQKAATSVHEALYAEPESVAGESLGEKMVEGAAYINATMARNIGGAGASSEEAIAEYTRATQDLIAFEIEADRASRSPFDATSPNTFLGSIVNSTFSTILRSKSLAGGFGNVAETAGGEMLATLGGNVYADGSEEEYATSYGNCQTVNSITGAKGDLYCNPNPTFDTKTYSMTLEELEARVGGGNVSGGEVVDDSDLMKYLVFNDTRVSTPGVMDAGICEALGEDDSLVGKAIKFITGKVSLACRGKNKRIARGEEYANTGTLRWNDKYSYYQGYVLETYVLELAGYYDDSKNPTVAALERYYEENPLDNSYIGVIARRTGLSKDEVIAGIEGIVYLAWLDGYNPAERYAFMDLPEEPEFPEELDEKRVVSDNKQRDARVLTLA